MLWLDQFGAGKQPTKTLTDAMLGDPLAGVRERVAECVS